MENFEGIENESDQDANPSDLKAYLEKIKLKKGLEEAISTHEKTQKREVK